MKKFSWKDWVNEENEESNPFAYGSPGGRKNRLIAYLIMFVVGLILVSIAR